jgi:hypothetical protein
VQQSAPALPHILFRVHDEYTLRRPGRQLIRQTPNSKINKQLRADPAGGLSCESAHPHRGMVAGHILSSAYSQTVPPHSAVHTRALPSTSHSCAPRLTLRSAALHTSVTTVPPSKVALRHRLTNVQHYKRIRSATRVRRSHHAAARYKTLRSAHARRATLSYCPSAAPQVAQPAEREVPRHRDDRRSCAWASHIKALKCCRGAAEPAALQHIPVLCH